MLEVLDRSYTRRTRSGGHVPRRAVWPKGTIIIRRAAASLVVEGLRVKVVTVASSDTKAFLVYRPSNVTHVVLARLAVSSVAYSQHDQQGDTGGGGGRWQNDMYDSSAQQVYALARSHSRTGVEPLHVVCV